MDWSEPTQATPTSSPLRVLGRSLIIHHILVEFLGCRGKAPQRGAAAAERQISLWNSRHSQHEAGETGACCPSGGDGRGTRKRQEHTKKNCKTRLAATIEAI